MRRTFSPLNCIGHSHLGRCPRLVLTGPSALNTTVLHFSTEGALHTSLGQRPRKMCPIQFRGLKVRLIENMYDSSVRSGLHPFKEVPFQRVERHCWCVVRLARVEMPTLGERRPTGADVDVLHVIFGGDSSGMVLKLAPFGAVPGSCGLAPLREPPWDR